MDLNLLKARLDGLQSKSSNSGSKIDYSTIFWNPKIGKHQIRIVPSAYDSKTPFTELKFYYGITNKVMISPSNFGEKDPIALFAAKLREEYNKENYVLAKKLDSKVRIFAPVVVRGEEDKIGDYTDIVSGRDLTIDTVGPESTGTPYNKSSVRVRLKSTSLSENKTEAQTWLDNQPKPKELFKRYTFDEMKSALEKWLAPEAAENEGDIISEPASDFDDAIQPAPTKSNFSMDTSKVKQTKSNQFDSLFDKPKSVVEEDDDLPF